MPLAPTVCEVCKKDKALLESGRCVDCYAETSWTFSVRSVWDGVYGAFNEVLSGFFFGLGFSMATLLVWSLYRH